MKHGNKIPKDRCMGLNLIRAHMELHLTHCVCSACLHQARDEASKIQFPSTSILTLAEMSLISPTHSKIYTVHIFHKRTTKNLPWIQKKTGRLQKPNRALGRIPGGGMLVTFHEVQGAHLLRLMSMWLLTTLRKMFKAQKLIFSLKSAGLYSLLLSNNIPYISHIKELGNRMELM